MNAKTRKPGTPRANKGKAIIDLSKGRICVSCSEYKNRDHFYDHPSGFNGLGSKCKECISSEPVRPSKKKLYQERKDKHLCVKCGLPSLKTNVFCLDCWFNDRASYRLKSILRVSDLKKLWNDQDGKCFYTGEVLIPGENASIDHQIPRSKGGNDDITNLRWVTNQVNMIKSSLTHEQFLDFCKKISEKFNG